MDAPGTHGRKTWWSQARDGSWRRWNPVTADWEPAEGPPPPEESLPGKPDVVRDPWKAAREGTGFGDYLRSKEFRRSLLPHPRRPAPTQPDAFRFLSRLLLMGGLLGIVSWAFNRYMNAALVDSGLGEAGASPGNWALLAFSVMLIAGSFGLRVYRKR